MNVPTILMWMCIAGCATWVVLCLADLNDKFCWKLPYLRRYDRLKRRMKTEPTELGLLVMCKHRLYSVQCPVCILHRKIEAAKLQLELDKLNAELNESLPYATEEVDSEELP